MTKLDLEREVHQLFAAKMREFAEFCAEHWTLTKKDMAKLHPEYSEEYRNGYNAAMGDGVSAALASFLDEAGITP